MTDDDLIRRLEHVGDFIEKHTKSATADPERMRFAMWEIRHIIKILRCRGFDRIPRLITDLAFRGCGFPPQNGMN